MKWGSLMTAGGHEALLWVHMCPAHCKEGFRARRHSTSDHVESCRRERRLDGELSGSGKRRTGGRGPSADAESRYVRPPTGKKGRKASPSGAGRHRGNPRKRSSRKRRKSRKGRGSSRAKRSVKGLNVLFERDRPRQTRPCKQIHEEGSQGPEGAQYKFRQHQLRVAKQSIQPSRRIELRGRGQNPQGGTDLPRRV